MSNKDKEKGEIEKRTKAYISSSANQLTNAAPETVLLQSNFWKQRRKNKHGDAGLSPNIQLFKKISKKQKFLGFSEKHTSENVFFTGIKQSKTTRQRTRNEGCVKVGKNVCKLNQRVVQILCGFVKHVEQQN